MLERLEVRNLAVLEEVALELGPGLTVMTGETGAGKSVLVDALSLLLGERAEGMVRPGSDGLLVSAWFNQQVLSRRVASGRSTPRLDGEVVSLRELSEAAAAHLAIHAQHAALGLVGRKAQRERLDSLLSPDLLGTYRQAYAHYQALLAEQNRLSQAARERERRLDTLSFQAKEIAEARITPGEELGLQAQAERLRHLETLRERVATAIHLLSGDPDAVGVVASATRELKAAARYDPQVASLSNDLEVALNGLRAVARELEDHLETLDADPAKLEELEQRLAMLERLKRKYGNTLEEVVVFGQTVTNELAALEGADQRLEALGPELLQAHAQMLKLGQTLSQQRQQAAQKLSQSVTQEVRALGMPAAHFEVSLQPLETPSSDGLEEVQFWFSANPGLPKAPLEKAASGGELSRVMLALALLTGSEAPTVVFDEVDAGIGGEAAWAVAERLARLAQSRQVLVVTHLAQIAAKAQQHFKVQKEQGRVWIGLVHAEDRVRELARMLSGSYSESALQHARELLRL